ncbi:sigma-Y antisigma factor component [Bacillaceae bacterium CLA-AA-H227]|uniref:Sigma-Y antisigma factor component n=1 Tax=Robertmurraya yapensis (ex Hitch et al 2024) TaxID=3133160 RepID=A0ACC6SHU3_9BACI
MNEQISLPLVFMIGVILISQSIFLFINARKYGHNYWFWGTIGLIQAPMPTLFYLLFARKIWKKT